MRRQSIAEMYRRPIAILAAGLIVVQALVAGLAVARAALMATDPFAAVICHSGASNSIDDGTAPDPVKEIHLCCFACMAGSPAATLPQQTLFFGFEPSLRGLTGLLASVVDIPTADRSVRAGQSQAPPGHGLNVAF